MLRRLALLTVAVVAAVVAAGRRARGGEYVGMDHPSGELRLRLEPDGRFSLRLAVWDAVVGEFVAQRELTGEWRQRHDVLDLRAAGRQLTYTRAAGDETGWIWQRSTLPTFADGIRLVAERRVVSPIEVPAGVGAERRRVT